MKSFAWSVTVYRKKTWIIILRIPRKPKWKILNYDVGGKRLKIS